MKIQPASSLYLHLIFIPSHWVTTVRGAGMTGGKQTFWKNLVRSKLWNILELSQNRETARLPPQFRLVPYNTTPLHKKFLLNINQVIYRELSLPMNNNNQLDLIVNHSFHSFGLLFLFFYRPAAWWRFHTRPKNHRYLNLFMATYFNSLFQVVSNVQWVCIFSTRTLGNIIDEMAMLFYSSVFYIYFQDCY